MPASRLLRFVFWLILLVMLVLVGISLLTDPTPTGDAALNATQVEQTVQAAVDQRLTAVAAQATPTAFPDIEATVQFRLTVTPTPAPEVSPVEEVTGGIWSFLRSIWNLFAFGGIWLQICCCLLLPGAVLLLFINDTRPRR